MRAGLSLTWKIALLAILTLVMLTVVLLIFAGVQFRISPENFIVAPAFNRVLSVSGELAQDLGETPVESRAELLEQLSKQYDVDFYLVDGNGNSLTRTPAALPKEIVDEIGQRFRNGGPRPAPRRAIFRATTGSPASACAVIAARINNSNANTFVVRLLLSIIFFPAFRC